MTIDVTKFVEASGPTEFTPLPPGFYKVSCLDVTEIENNYGESFQFELQVHQPRRKIRTWLDKPTEDPAWYKLSLCFKSFGKDIIKDACHKVGEDTKFEESKVEILKGAEAIVELYVSNDGKNNRVKKWLPIDTKTSDEPQPAVVASDDDDDIPF